MKLKIRVVEKSSYAPVSLSSANDQDHVYRSAEEGVTGIVLKIAKDYAPVTRQWNLLPRRVAAIAKREGIEALAIDLETVHYSSTGMSQESTLEQLIVELYRGAWQYHEYKSGHTVKTLAIDIVVPKDLQKEVKKSQKVAEAIATEIDSMRTIATRGGSDMTPASLASHARISASSLPIDVQVLDIKAMEKLGMGGVLTVGKGSTEKPCFIVMEYKPVGTKKMQAPVVLVGKGVTFDTGGVNVKPGDYMQEMQMDMSGGAAVIHTICAVAKLGLKTPVVALIPAVENAISGSAYRPGDIIRTLGGKTIEVLNTDAEGRIILADAIEYAKRYKPSSVIDVATLTGSAMSALGQRASALLSESESLVAALTTAGGNVGDEVWRLPLWSDYDDEVKGTFGDVMNVGKTRYGGATTAGAFLKAFADGLNWAHIDMAPRMTPTKDEYLNPGSAGATVALLTEYIRSLSR
jgi:leucyl aminopeptidase